MMNILTFRMLSARHLALHRSSSIVNRKWLIPFLSLSLLPLISCGRYRVRDELAQNQFFAEILKREDHRWIGEDSFFESNLANPYPEVRQWSAIALGRIASPQALPALYKALHTGDAAVRAASAFAIGEIEDREWLEAQYLDPDPAAEAELTHLLDDPSLTVRMRAVEALGKTGSRAAGFEIARRVERFHYSGMPFERAYLESAITALVRLKYPAAFPVLDRLADMSDPEVKWRALDALVRFHSKAAGSLFIQNLESRDSEVRSCAARGVGTLEDPRLAVLLLPLLPPRVGQTRDPIPASVRFAALQALGELKNPAAISSIIAAIAAEPVDDAHPGQQHFAIHAAAALGRIGAIEGESGIIPLIRCSGPVANIAVIALARILRGNPERFFSLVDRNRFTDAASAPVWIRAMAELGGSKAIAELHRMLVQTAEKTDTSGTEALPAILAALAKINDPGLQDLLSPFFDSQDTALLRAVVAAYQPKAGAKEPYAPIVRAFKACASTGDGGSKIEILTRLKPWIREPAVQQALRSGLEDPSRSVRFACAGLLRRAGASNIAGDPGFSNGTLGEAFCYVLAASRKNSTIARLETNRGTMEIELFREDAPVTVANFVLTANRGIYNGLEFSRTVPSRLIEGRITRTEPGSTIKSEINMRPFERGSVGMAIAGGDSETGRFFIALAPQPYLDGVYTCFGRVISGMQVADRIVPGDRVRRIQIKETISLLDYHWY
jgi:peptidyl-prolyl cis-trans isomerase B (cyclophilin B)